ncbi:glutathione S-transferase family protein [Phreatobacter oligotrophus]|jgi:glutathione S-transferase|uniref:Glutathione S-transferase n=1 Tax=Phreatobacter oligotrophus TaxID=1122261 RepID=A0A2T4ZI60_9HYPH|nr:glutathione S-transferase N-terminal domain-containing protein [Phreatobacter oligotrophus]PTM61654.1 glutathione S-transferase [Phreatobacter oligotrophus]
MTWKFFYGPKTCALASRIALEEAGAAYEPVRVDFASGEQTKPAYLAINPKGRVPALVTDRGVLTENVAILAFVAQSHPDKNLAPLSDPFAFAEMQAFNAYLASTVHVNHAHKHRGHRWATEESSFLDMRRKVPETMAASFRLIENDFFRGPWVMGEAYSVADAYLFTVTRWLEGDGVDVAQFPRVAEHLARMGERPSVKAALAYE